MSKDVKIIASFIVSFAGVMTAVIAWAVFAHGVTMFMFAIPVLFLLAASIDVAMSAGLVRGDSEKQETE